MSLLSTSSREFSIPRFVLLVLALASPACVPRHASLPPPAAATGADSFVDEVRKITAERGLVAATDHLKTALAERDESHGVLETRLRRTTADADFVYPDSFAALSAAQRERIGFAFVPGMRVKQGMKTSKPVQAFAAATEAARSRGFQACLIPAISDGLVEKNEEAMTLAMHEVFANADHVVLMAKSKGAHDLIAYLSGDGAALPARQRDKLKAVCFLAGTVQGSYVADWFARHSSPWPTGGRALLVATGRGKRIQVLKKMADSPWKDLPAGFPGTHYDQLTFISLVVLPDGEDGHPNGTVWSPFFSKEIRKTIGWETPNDSLVESAAEVIPEWIDTPQWIIRTSGMHAFPKGRFLDGSKLAPHTPTLPDNTLNPEAGREIMDAFLRALPVSLLRG